MICSHWIYLLEYYHCFCCCWRVFSVESKQWNGPRVNAIYWMRLWCVCYSHFPLVKRSSLFCHCLSLKSALDRFYHNEIKLWTTWTNGKFVCNSQECLYILIALHHYSRVCVSNRYRMLCATYIHSTHKMLIDSQKFYANESIWARQ